MATEQVYDPDLGEKRDAFPGEVVAPEQEKTLNRLMRLEEERFTTDLAEVKATGKLSSSDEDAVRKFAILRAEIQRQKYLEALNSNPANILQNILKEFEERYYKQGSNSPLGDALAILDENVDRLQRNFAVQRASDKMTSEKKDTVQNVKDYLGRGGSEANQLTTIESLFRSGFTNADYSQLQKITFEILKKLGLLPEESLASFADLKDAVKSTGITNSRDLSTYLSGAVIGNLSSSKPGLEGIKAKIFASDSDFNTFSNVIVFGSPQALARVVDKGQYVPYASSKT